MSEFADYNKELGSSLPVLVNNNSVTPYPWEFHHRAKQK